MPLNSQEVFDTVATHLMNQGRQAFDDEKLECRYRAPNGDMCAVGCLIPDDVYDAGMEGLGASDVVWNNEKVADLFDSSMDYDLLDDLQYAHDEEMMVWAMETDDEVLSMSNWAEEMRRVARNHGLSAAVLDGYEG